MMLKAFDSHTIFCEIARQEGQGKVSLIGVLPDSLSLEGPPKPEVESGETVVPTLKSLCLNVRNRIPISEGIPGELVVNFVSPSGANVFSHTFDPELVEKAYVEARKAKKVCLTMVAQFALDNFPIKEEGRFGVTVEYAGEQYFSGALNIIVPEGLLTEPTPHEES